jgi:hydroxyacyl-ACP dehydratase HTD2-like protein with hotdog domain
LIRNTERLVHGPLTALMLLETLRFHKPNAQFKCFEYRAVNPLVVGKSVTMQGAMDTTNNSVHLWAQNSDGVVGMMGKVTL